MEKRLYLGLGLFEAVEVGMGELDGGEVAREEGVANRDDLGMVREGG